MNDRELDFFRRLCAPFQASDLAHKSVGGRTLTYAKSRTLMNRLDDVCGPAGWSIEYRETDRGYIARLGILVPVGTSDVWLFKEDGGGTEGMTKKAGGGQVADDDNDEKSAFTNAFRRVCCAWGPSRYLWKEGVPAYLGAAPAVPEPPAGSIAPPAAAAAPARSQTQESGRFARNAGPAPQAQPASRPTQQGGYDNFRVPKAGRAPFAWAKGLEKHFGVDGVVRLMDEIARDRGYAKQFNEWDQDTTDDVCWTAITEIKTWDCYKGEFEHLSSPESLQDFQ